MNESCIRTDEDGSTVLDLVYPLKDADGIEIKTLVFRRATAADLLAMDEAKGDVAKAIKAISRVCNISVVMVNKLDGYDFIQAQGVLASFLSKPL